jgi:hypothetical protein
VSTAVADLPPFVQPTDTSSNILLL